MSYDEFCGCLGLCAHIKYEEVEQMGHAESSAAIICNLFGEKDEQQVITEAVVPQPVRFDPSKQPPLPGESAEEHARWLGVWRRMDLAHINGFPLWEQVRVRVRVRVRRRHLRHPTSP